MNDWYGTAKRIIAELHATLPADMGLHERHQACIRAKPFEFASTSWGQKTWARAQREYLVRYGYQPRTAPLPESSLDRAKRRGDDDMDRLRLSGIVK